MIRPAIFSVLLLASACTRDDGAYPSLAPRAVEKLGFAEPETVEAVAAPDPALDARLAPVAAKLTELKAGFDRDAAAAQRAGVAARGRPVGSEAWLAAQAALAELDGWRAQVSTLVGDLDALAVARAQALEPPYAALTVTRDAVRAEAERQSAEIARLQALTPSA